MTGRGSDFDRNVIALRLSESAAQNPTKVVVRDQATSLTLEQLDSLTNSFSSRIHELLLAHPSQKIVPLILDRSVNSVIAIYSVIKAGIGFALIDAENTSEFIDSALRKLGDPDLVVITDEQQRPLLLNNSSILVSQKSQGGAAFLAPAVARNETAVVLFTSGTSGDAKGVIYDWQTLHEVFSRNIPQIADDDPGARCVNFASFGFLAGLLRTLLICEGVSVALIDPRTTNARELLASLARERLTVISMTPSLAQTINSLDQAVDLLPTVKVIYTYGESVISRELSSIRRVINSRARIVHRYDASEAPGGVFRFEIGSGEVLPAHYVPLGKAIHEGRVFLEPVPTYPDDIREIVVKGLVAQGYLGQPQLTQERFGVDADGVRYWKSNDLVRITDNGELIHEGRADNLVKVNGKVVSTKFVEMSLLTIPGIRKAAVVAERKFNSRYVLSAHVEVDPLLNMSANLIMEKLQNLGISTALPRKIFRHEILPLTNRGKVDYKSLREKDWPEWLDTRSVTPSRELEAALQKKIARVLNLTEIHLDQDLSKAGMDSLAAIELSVIINGMGFRNVQPTDFFEYSTIREIAQYLESIAVGGGSTTFTFNPEGRQKPIFVLLPAGQSPLIFHGLAEVLGANQPLVAITSIDFSAENLRLRTVEKIAARHLETARTIQPEGSLNLIGYCFGAIVAYDMAQLDNNNGGHASVMMLDSWFPNLHLDGPTPTAPVAALIARQFRKTPKAIAEGAYYRTLTKYYRGSGKLPPNFTKAQNFLPKLLSYSWYEIAADYRPAPATFPVTYIEGNEGQVMKDMERLIPAELRTLRRVDAVHGNILDPASLPVIATALQS